MPGSQATQHQPQNQPAPPAGTVPTGRDAMITFAKGVLGDLKAKIDPLPGPSDLKVSLAAAIADLATYERTRAEFDRAVFCYAMIPLKMDLQLAAAETGAGRSGFLSLDASAAQIQSKSQLCDPQA